MAAMDLDKLAELSDEELAKTTSIESPVPVAPVEEKKPAEQPKEPVEEPPPADEEPGQEDPPPQEEQQPKPEDKKPDPEGKKADEPPLVASKLADPAKKDGPDAFVEGQKKPDEKPPVTPAAGEQKKPEEKQADPAAPKKDEQPAHVLDYKSLYERVMGSFKANGKEFKPASIDEVIQLMQMGANYTKKMQELTPVRKFVMMLQNADLLDEGKLSFLIDLHRKDPEAIKKLLVDAKIDPVELDVSKTNYRPNKTHAVSDQEVALNSVIDDLNGQDGGKETLQSVQSWDKASKEALWENPEILRRIHGQRLNGIFAKITAEMDRQMALGTIPRTTPFLGAYKAVGDELERRGAFGSVTQPASSGSQKPASGPVAVRTAPAKPGTKVDDKRVAAAAPTRTSPRTATPITNYLSGSDEEFLKLPPPKF